VKIAAGLVVVLGVLFAQPNLLGADQPPENARPRQTVKEEYGKLKAAMLNAQGSEAAGYVTDETIGLYEHSRKIALDSRDIDFDSISTFEVLLVFQLRFMLDKNSLQKMDGRSIFAWGVKNGLIKKDVLKSFEVNKVVYEGKLATATILKHGKPVDDAIFHLSFEEGVWKFDMLPMAEEVDRALDALRKQADKSKIETALILLERTHKTKIPPAILNGPLK
jgi:hypothetical protein